jgi:hypothetical protein
MWGALEDLQGPAFRKLSREEGRICDRHDLVIVGATSFRLRPETPRHPVEAIKRVGRYIAEDRADQPKSATKIVSVSKPLTGKGSVTFRRGGFLPDPPTSLTEDPLIKVELSRLRRAGCRRLTLSRELERCQVANPGMP